MIFSEEEYSRRVRRVESAVKEAGLDALIAYSVKNQPGPVMYLVGYEPKLGLHDVVFFVLTPDGNPRYTLVTNVFWEDLKQCTWVDEILVTSDFATGLAEFLPQSARKIGLAGYRFFPTPVYLGLKAHFPMATFEDATPLLWQIARVKSPDEISVLRQTISITDEGGRAFLKCVRDGISEREVQIEVEQAVMLAGAEGMSFSTQVYSGPRVAVCVGFSSERALNQGEQVQLDCGAIFHGYRGDLSRVTSVGRPSPEVRGIMETTAEMYEAMLVNIRPGVPAGNLAQAAIEVARDRGMESYIFRSPNHPVGFMGHGIGCWYHEPPEIHPEEHSLLEANMTIVLEAILGQPGVGGAKIEDPVLVTPIGPERLSRLELRPWLE